MPEREVTRVLWVLGLLLWGCAGEGQGAAAGPVGDGRSSDGGYAILDAPLGPGCLHHEEHLPAEPGGWNHTDVPVETGELPPAWGPHTPACWGHYGVYDEPLPPHRWMHNLEHGAVVFLHNCPQGCEDELRQMESVVAGRERVIMTPYAGMAVPFAVVAAEYRLLLDCMDRDALAEFYLAHHDRAPESVPSGPGADCPQGAGLRAPDSSR